MSVAEKLEALAEKPVLNMFKIGDALPQLVAVVEAAERAAKIEQPRLRPEGEMHYDLRAALSALDEALS